MKFLPLKYFFSKKIILVLIGTTFVFFSCVKDIDTVSLKDETFVIPMDLALVDLNVKGTEFGGASGTTVTLPYLIDFRGFFYESTTDRADFVSTLSNSFDERITVTYRFFDQDSIILPLRLYHEIGPNTLNETQILPIEGDFFTDFKKSRLINAVVSYEGFPIGINDLDSVDVQSKLSFDYILPLDQ